VRLCFLIIDDQYWGGESGGPLLLVNLLLSQYPAVPLEFIIDASPRHTVSFLCLHYPRDIIGRRAEHTILCTGWGDLRSSAPVDDVIRKHRQLIRDILAHGKTQPWLITFPEPNASDDPVLSEKIRLFNQYLRSLPGNFHTHLVDFDQIIKEYQKKQSARGDMIRGLFQETGNLNSLGQTLLAWNFASKIAIACDLRD